MMKLRQLADLSGNSETYIAHALADRGQSLGDSPVYVQFLTAIGGWLSASFLLAAWGAFFSLGSSLSYYAIPALMGVAAGLFLRWKFIGVFVRQMGAGLLIAGQVGTGLAMTDWGGAGSFTLVALAIASITLFVEQKGFAIPVTFAVVFSGFATYLLDHDTGVLRDGIMAATCVFAGLSTLMIKFKGFRVEFIGLMALLALVIYAEISTFQWSAQSAVFQTRGNEQPVLHIWSGKTAVWLGTLALLYWSRRFLNHAEIVLTLIVMTGFFLVMPFASVAALFLLLVGATLGWHPAAIAGVIAIIWTLSRYYYDLSFSLLQKSMLLMVVGAILLGAAYLAQRHMARESAE